MTVQQVFDMAIHIVDEQSESTGATITVDTEEYKFRTISILNAVIPRLFPYSETCSPEDIRAFRTNPQGKQRGEDGLAAQLLSADGPKPAESGL